MSILLLLSDSPPPGADISFNGPMLAMPYSLQRLGFTYVRNSLKTVYQGGSLVTLAANQFGTTYDAVTGLHAFEAEPAATNLVLNSILAGGGAAPTSWTQGVATGTSAPAASIYGTASGAIAYLQGAAIGERPYIQQTVAVSANTTYSVSVLVESVVGAATIGDVVYSGSLPSGTRTFYLNGTLMASTDPLATGIIVMRLAIGATGGNIVARLGVGAAGGATAAMSVQFSRPQFETGVRRTSWIATTTATVTRAADVLSDPTANIPGFNAAGYTLAVDMRLDIPAFGNQFSLCLSDGTSNNRACLFRTTTTSSNIVVSGGAGQANQTLAATDTGRGKSATSVALNSVLFSRNGTAAAADTGATMPVAPNVLHVGSLNGSLQLNGYIYGFKLIPVALNQAQTTALTS